MGISGVNSGIMGSMMIQMKQMVDLNMKDALEKANEDYGNPLGTTIDFSKPSELISKLEQLKNEDPQKFKDILKEISDTLKTAATDTEGTDSNLSSFLTMLSDKFAEVSETGDISKLAPPEPKHQEGVSQSKVAQYDSNSGGQQSLLEMLMALLQQLGASSATASNSDYDTSTTVKSLLAKALQELTNSANTGTASNATTNSVENLLAEAIQELNGDQA
ncbi:MAG: hypothetical protein WCX65_09800 [bacterium]